MRKIITLSMFLFVALAAVSAQSNAIHLYDGRNRDLGVVTAGGSSGITFLTSKGYSISVDWNGNTVREMDVRGPSFVIASVDEKQDVLYLVLKSADGKPAKGAVFLTDSNQYVLVEIDATGAAIEAKNIKYYYPVSDSFLGPKIEVSPDVALFKIRAAERSEIGLPIERGYGIVVTPLKLVFDTH